MKKRRILLLLSLLMIVMLVTVLSSCSATVVDMDDYLGTDNGYSKLSIMGKLVMLLHGGIKNYGVTVIVFTIIVKVITLPIEFWQRYASKKSIVKQQEMQPMMDALEKKYAKDPQRLNMEKSKLLRQQGMSALGMCLPLIVTMAVFIFMFSGLTNYATYNTVINYNKLETFYQEQYEKAMDDDNVYLAAYNSAIDAGKTPKEAEEIATLKAIEVASKGDGGEYIGIGKYYTTEIKQSFLWIENVWQPDTWANIMPTYDEFTKTVKLSGTSTETTYNLIRDEVIKTHSRNQDGSWNGLMILPFASIGLSFLSIWLMQRVERKNRKGEIVSINAQQARTNKTMMFVTPLIMAIFAFIYTGALAIYMVFSSLFNILSTLCFRPLVNKAVERSIKKQQSKNATPKANYKR